MAHSATATSPEATGLVRALRRYSIVLAFLLALVAAPIARAQPSVVDITSAGPLTNVWVGSDLSCQVAETGDTSYQFFPSDSAPGGCGTFLAVGGELYGPDFTDDDGASPFPDDPTYTVFTASVPQSAVSGSGTAASPYQITTKESVANSGLDITEVDSYVVGNAYYRTDITVSNSGAAPVSALLYHAGDCYLEGSDVGYGYVDPANNAVACTANPDNSPAGQVEEFVPLTGSIHYVEAGYYSTWTGVANQADLPDTCDCTTDEDNGAGINWDISVPAGGATTESMLTNFSSAGQVLDPPGVVTGAASAVSQTAATLNATVNPEANAVTDCEFQWGTSTAYGNSVPCAAQPAGSGDSPVAVSAALSSLSANTTYHFRVLATNGYGTSYGSDATFITPPPTGVPGVVPSSPVVSGFSGVGLSGSVVANGLTTSAYFEYGLDPRYSGGGPVVYDEVTATQTVGAGFGGVAVSALV
ncbi:MAG: hypothetical protein ACLP50_03935, partial [Solirubrobacteraceae bacterium]